MTTIPTVARSLPSKPAPQQEASEPEPEKNPPNENASRIKEVCELLGMKGKKTAAAYQSATMTQGLDKPSGELTPPECSRVIDEILSHWGLQQGCFKAINHSRSAFALLMENPDISREMHAIVAAWRTECHKRVQAAKAVKPACDLVGIKTNP